GGALISALVISTTLAEGSFRISKLQQSNQELARQRQILQENVAAAQSAQVIQARALQLGMRPAGEPRDLNLKTGTVQAGAGRGAVAAVQFPGSPGGRAAAGTGDRRGGLSARGARAGAARGRLAPAVPVTRALVTRARPIAGQATRPRAGRASGPVTRPARTAT